MLFHLPTLPTILIDIAAWFAIHMGVSYLMTHIPLSSFDAKSWLYKQRKWEKDGGIYEKILFCVKEVEKKITRWCCYIQRRIREETPQEILIMRILIISSERHAGLSLLIG